jgi:hypothetical protein
VKAKPFLLGFFVVVVAIAAVSIYVNETVDKTDKTVTAVVSPDGKYKAVRETIARGGKEPFCFDTISIFLSVYPDSFAESDKAYEVFAAACAELARRAALPKIEWLSGRSVQITYAASAAASDAMKMRTKQLDASKFVHLTFVAAQ